MFFLNLDPLKKNRDYRYLFLGQMVSFFGSMVTYVAIPYQVYQLTKDNALVGMLGVVQLVPLLFFGLVGGTYADRLNRRKLLLYSEGVMCLIVLALCLNAWLETPSLTAVFILVALFQAVMGFHRPAMEAITQKLVDKKDYAAVSALGGFRYSAGAIIGPALGGVLISTVGLKGAYLFDLFTFCFSIVAIYLIKNIPNQTKSVHSAWTETRQGIQYAFSKPELVGTYLVDIVAMLFAFPVALFPSISEKMGGAQANGILFSSMAVGSLIITLFSGWTSKIQYRGRAVIFSALLWAVFIIFLGQYNTLWLCATFLVLAGAADSCSGIFRGAIWNETVPNEIRGRLSGIEMISYMSGPLLGNARAGWMASKYSVPFSISGGGAICATAILVTAVLLPKFWLYRSEATVMVE